MFAKRFCKAFTALACLSCLVAGSNLRAQELEETSLTLAPADVSFFSASVNMDDAWNDFVESPFVTRLRSTRYIQEVERELMDQWENPQSDQVRMAKGMLASPNVASVLQLLTEMFSNESFAYGGSDWCDAIDGMMAMQADLMQASNQGPEAILEYLATIDQAQIDAIKIPSIVLGFRIEDEDNAMLQLSALEGIMRLGGSQMEELQPLLRQLKSKEFKDGLSLTLNFNTSMIPEEILEEIEEEDGGEIAIRLIEMLDERNIALSMGVREGLMLFAFGESADIIHDFGNNSSTLLSRPEFEYLKEANPENLRSVVYISEQFQKAQWEANFSSYFSNLTGQFATVLEALEADNPGIADWAQSIQSDAGTLDEMLAGLSDHMGASLSWSQKIDGGIEGYGYNWSDVGLQNAAPIQILDHAGDAPLIVLGSKSLPNEMAGEMMEFIFSHADDHVRNLIELMEDDGEERERMLTIFDKSWPLAVEVFEIIRDKMVPAMSDNEAVVSISSGWTIQQLPDLPPAAKPLPLPEMASAFRISDRAAFLGAWDELYKVADKVVDVIREFDESGSVPSDYSVPRPVEADAGSGATRYTYTELIENVPLEGFMPQAVIGDDVFILGYSERQVQSMLQSRELKTRPAWLDDETPVAQVSYVDFAGIFAAIRPWAEFGFQMSGLPLDEPFEDEELVPTPNDLLEIWDCLEAVGQIAATLTVGEEGEPSVSHYVWVGE